MFFEEIWLSCWFRWNLALWLASPPGLTAHFLIVLLGGVAISQAGEMPRHQPCPWLREWACWACTCTKMSISLEVQFVFTATTLRYSVISFLWPKWKKKILDYVFVCRLRERIFWRRARHGTVHQITRVLSCTSLIIIILEINVFDVSFISLMCPKLINNLDYLFCSFCFMKIKIHANVLQMYSLDLNGTADQVPLCQSEPKRKTVQRWLSWSFWKEYFPRLLENLSFMEMHHQLGWCFGNVKCK